MDLAFTHGTVLAFDPAFTIHEDCDVVLRGDRIAAVGPGAAQAFTGRTIDARELVLMPGLLNAHTHSPENFAKGRNERSTLDEWLPHVWSHIDTLSPVALRVAVLLGAGEMLRSGVTAVVDHFRQLPQSEAAIDAAAQSYHDVGLRAIVAPMLRDRVVPAGRTVAPPSEQVALIDEAVVRWATRKTRVRIGFGPSAPNRCTDALLGAVSEAAWKRGAIVHMHVDETAAEAARCRALYGESAVRHLDSIGLLDPALSIAHGVWIDHADILSLARARAIVVHNPVSNMRLGDGIAPITAMRRAGVRIAIGTDGAGSNDGQNMFEAVKAAVFLERISGAPPADWMAARDGLRHATNHAAFGLPGGRLEVGAVADIVAIATASYGLTPANDLHRQIVHGAATLDVRYVTVGGDLLLDDGRIITFDEAAMLAEARSIAAALYRA